MGPEQAAGEWGALATIVAARNEADRIAETVRALRSAFPGARVWVADDASEDGTAEAALAGGRRGGQPRPTARQGRERHRRRRGGGERSGPAAPRPSLRRRPRRLGRAAGAAGRGGGRGRVRPRRRRLQPPGRRWVRTRARLRPLGDPAALRPATEAPISGQRAMRAEVLRATLPFAPGYGMEIGMTVDAVRAGYRLRSTSSTSSTGRREDLAGFLHRARQLRDFTRVYWPRRERAPGS